jgi:antitoxin MazE
MLPIKALDQTIGRLRRSLTGQRHSVDMDGRSREAAHEGAGPLLPHPRLTTRSSAVALDQVGNIVHNSKMTKRLQAIGNSAGIIIDRPILDLLGITQDTDLDLKTDGKRLIITPLESERSRRGRLAKVQARVLRRHAETFRKLAK